MQLTIKKTQERLRADFFDNGTAVHRKRAIILAFQKTTPVAHARVPHHGGWWLRVQWVEVLIAIQDETIKCVLLGAWRRAQAQAKRHTGQLLKILNRFSRKPNRNKVRRKRPRSIGRGIIPARVQIRESHLTWRKALVQLTSSIRNDGITSTDHGGLQVFGEHFKCKNRELPSNFNHENCAILITQSPIFINHTKIINKGVTCVVGSLECTQTCREKKEEGASRQWFKVRNIALSQNGVICNLSCQEYDGTYTTWLLVMATSTWCGGTPSKKHKISTMGSAKET